MPVALAASQLASVSLLEYSTLTGDTAFALAALLAVLLVEPELLAVVVTVVLVPWLVLVVVVAGAQAASRVVHSTAARVESRTFLGCRLLAGKNLFFMGVDTDPFEY